MGFTKLDSGIIRSSIWFESLATRILWITILALKDENGFVASSKKGLQASANISFEDFEAGIRCLESPDEDSRSEDFEGRRIRKVEGGWIVLNHEKYREHEDIQREKARERMRKLRSNSENVREQSEQFANSANVREPSVSVSVSVSESVSVKKEGGLGEISVPDHLSGVWGDFMEIRKKRKAVNSPRALNSILNELNRLSSNNDEQVKIVEQSIRSSWKDVYKLKGENNEFRTGKNRGNAERAGYDSSGTAVGAVARTGEFDEGVITMESVGSRGKT